MVDSDKFKDKVQEIASQEYNVEFLGKNFDKVVNSISESQIKKIYSWIREVVKEEIQPIFIGSKKSYKDWTINQLLTFRYAFSVNNTEYRILFVKVKNSLYIEFHLGDHKYYDKVRKDLSLKKSSY